MELIFNIIYIYIAVYSVYFLILAIRNLNDRKMRVQEKYNDFNFINSIGLIIYSHNNEVALSTLVNQLKTQNYPPDKFRTYVILDNCQDNSEKLFINDDFVQVFSIKNQETVGKDQATSILLEKLSQIQSYDAYVFLDANRFIDQDFLYSVNSALTEAPVISGTTVLVGEKLNLRQKIKVVFHKYYTNFIQKGRSVAGLATTIDSDILIMRQDIMRTIGCIDFQNINTELKYSLLLSRIGFKCVFNPNIKTYIAVDEFTLRIPSLSARLALFKSCFAQIWGTNFVFNEHVLSLLAPNVCFLLIAYVYILKYAYNYYFFVDFSVVLISFVALVLGFSISLLKSKLKSTDFALLFLYPIYSVCHIIKNLPIFRIFKGKKSGGADLNLNTQKMEVEVSVTDGKNNIPCKLELISEAGLAKVKFTFKKKTFTTSTKLRMVDAIKELTMKLADYGFVLKICQCCSYFSPNVDGSTNMVKGFCSHEFSNKTQSDPIPTLLWNACKGFNHNKINSVIEEISLDF